MANHTHDCEFCGADLRLTGFCCEDNRTKERKAEEARALKEQSDTELVDKYGIDTWGEPNKDLVNFIRKLEDMDDACLKILAQEVKQKREATALKQATCTHRHPDGRSAWTGGFAEYDGCCSLCGKG